MAREPSSPSDKEVLKRLRQIYEAGGWVLVESTLADLPADLRWLYESGAVTLEQLHALHCTFGAPSIADLSGALQEDRLRAIPEIGTDVESAIRDALPNLRARVPRVPLGRAVELSDPFIAALRAISTVSWVEPSGSLRRGEDTVGDIELVASTSDPVDAIDELLSHAMVSDARCLHRSVGKVYLRKDRVQIGVVFPNPASAGAELVVRTGSRRHVTGLKDLATTAGLRLTSHGLLAGDGTLQPFSTEDELYAALGLPWIAPELRHGEDEIERATQGTLPALIRRPDMRGDLHMHTVWSDGRDSVESMVQGCRGLGYEYMAITDHSPSSAASRNLTASDAVRQAEEIAALREQYPDIAILHGCEVDILADGRLDFPDKTLERFDIVLASLHEGAGHSPDQLLKRYSLAMRHPLVSVVTHPTNRLIAHRPAYPIDYDRLFELAVETGTVLEIDGSPSHLDMDGALARRAIAAGASISIDSDSHRAEALDRQMQLGVLLARRGWVEPRHVVNTRPLADVRAIIARKRSGH